MQEARYHGHVQIQENVSLAAYTSLHVGGPARYFAPIKNDEDAVAAVRFAEENHLPFFVLGKGSNTIFPDTGYPGVLLHMEDRSRTRDGNTITAGSGVFMRQLVNFTHDHGLVGIEELAGIPGTVGGAVRGNAGTWSSETKDHLYRISVLERNEAGEWETATLSADKCKFGYRHSVFKEHPDWIILRATFSLNSGDVAPAKKAVQRDLQDRHARQPYDAPSAGSIFINPDLTTVSPTLKVPAGGSAAGRVSAGWLIDAVGLKGLRQGDAEISPKHANWIVNRGHATASDVLGLIKKMIEAVREQTGVTLHPEIQIVETEKLPK